MHQQTTNGRKRAIWLAGVCAGLALGTGSLRADDDRYDRENFQQGAREVGHTIGSVFREIGHGTRDFFRAIGHGTRDAVKAVGHAASEGGNGFKRGIKGEGEDERAD